MTGLLGGFVDQEYIPIVTWIIIAAVGLAVIYAAYRIFRILTSGTFISGGRNRRTRLAVMDAAAVDDKRRLVLVRRDDVEHLILIGGPTDVVVEQDIRMIPRATRQMAGDNDAAEHAEEPVAAQKQQHPSHMTPAARPIREFANPHPLRDRAPAARTAPPSAPAAPVSTPRPASAAVAPEPPRAATPALSGNAVEFRRDAQRTAHAAPPRAPSAPTPLRAVAGAGAPAAAARAEPANDIDSALLQELEDSLDISVPDGTATTDKSLEDEMTKLLGELSRDRR